MTTCPCCKRKPRTKGSMWANSYTSVSKGGSSSFWEPCGKTFLYSLSFPNFPVTWSDFEVIRENPRIFLFHVLHISNLSHYLCHCSQLLMYQYQQRGFWKHSRAVRRTGVWPVQLRHRTLSLRQMFTLSHRSVNFSFYSKLVQKF